MYWLKRGGGLGWFEAINKVGGMSLWKALFGGHAKPAKTQSSQTSAGIDHLPSEFVVFDLETTGLNVETHEIIEIAAILHTKGSNTHATIQSLVVPIKKIPKKITEVTGITQEMVAAGGIPLGEAITSFAEFVGDRRLVAFNAEFDMEFLQAAATKCGRPKFKNNVSCALKMARRAWPGLNGYKLTDLVPHDDAGKAHRALGDAQRALIVYAGAVAQLKSEK